ncbi:MAG: hypothetical protein IMW83_03955 [Caldanaerobacter subterraneus]|nr:hypothetical protein [Caldanaerobacter subterraneus]
MVIKKCERCGKEFITPTGKEKVCEACLIEIIKEKLQEKGIPLEEVGITIIKNYPLSNS